MKLKSGHLVQLYAASLRTPSGRVQLYAADLDLSAGQLVCIFSFIDDRSLSCLSVDLIFYFSAGQLTPSYAVTVWCLY